MPVTFKKSGWDSVGHTNLCAITGITLRFPVRVGGPTRDPSNPRDFFKISIIKSPRAADYSDSDSDDCDSVLSRKYEPSKGLVISPIKYEWGKVMEVKVEPRVLIDHWEECLIKLHQVC